MYYASEVNLRYGLNFKQEDFSVASSYELDTFTLGAGIAYKLNPKLKHNEILNFMPAVSVVVCITLFIDDFRSEVS